MVVLSTSEGGWNNLGHVPDTVGIPATANDGVSIDIAEKVAFASAGGLVLKEDNMCGEGPKKKSVYKMQGRIAIRMSDDGRYPFAMSNEASRFKSADANQEPSSIRNEIVEAARATSPDLIFQLAKKDPFDHGQVVENDPSALQPKRPEDGSRAVLDLKSLACRMRVLASGEVLLEIWRKRGKGGSDADPLLEVHMNSVAAAVERYAEGLGLAHDGHLAKLLGVAALLHDAGKADRRFQQMLYRSNVPLPAGSPLLAKDNGLPLGDHKRHYSKGFRHELVSSRLAESVDTTDRDLLLHLIESHHGHCRPNAPPVMDRDAGPVEYKFKGNTLRTSPATGLEKVGSGASRRFWSCTRTYGWWGLAWIEALFLLADWDVSGGSTQ